MRNRLRLLATAIAVAAATPIPVAGQSVDPDTPVVDGEIDPKPFDPRLEIREHFRRLLPPDWWASDPIYGTSLFQVTVHIPDRWRGNPTTAVMMLCPDRHSTLWQGDVDRILVHPFYRNRPWASIECRR